MSKPKIKPEAVKAEVDKTTTKTPKYLLHCAAKGCEEEGTLLTQYLFPIRLCNQHLHLRPHH